MALLVVGVVEYLFQDILEALHLEFLVPVAEAGYVTLFHLVHGQQRGGKLRYEMILLKITQQSTCQMRPGQDTLLMI